jgi:hypothetical protein
MTFTIFEYPRQPGDKPLGTLDFRHSYPWTKGIEDPMSGDLCEFILNQRHWFDPRHKSYVAVDLGDEFHQARVMTKLPIIGLEAGRVDVTPPAVPPALPPALPPAVPPAPGTGNV